jgi:hypothetical protein
MKLCTSKVDMHQDEGCKAARVSNVTNIGVFVKQRSYLPLPLEGFNDDRHTMSFKAPHETLSLTLGHFEVVWHHCC